jgi:hypothetical protein
MKIPQGYSLEKGKKEISDFPSGSDCHETYIKRHALIGRTIFARFGS